MESLLAHIFVGSQGELASSWAQHSRRYASPSLSVTVYCLSEFPSSPSEIWGTWGGKRCPGRRKGMEGGEVRRSRQSPGGIIRFQLTGLLGSPGQDPLAQVSIPHRPGTPLLPPPTFSGQQLVILISQLGNHSLQEPPPLLPLV